MDRNRSDPSPGSEGFKRVPPSAVVVVHLLFTGRCLLGAYFGPDIRSDCPETASFASSCDIAIWLRVRTAPRRVMVSFQAVVDSEAILSPSSGLCQEVRSGGRTGRARRKQCSA